MREAWRVVGCMVVALWMAQGCGKVVVNTGDNSACSTDEGCVNTQTCRVGVCASGVCEYDLVDGTCFIDGQCYQDGQEEPGNRCRSCTPGLSQEAFLNTQCEDGKSCDPASGECVAPEPDAVPDADGGGTPGDAGDAGPEPDTADADGGSVDPTDADGGSVDPGDAGDSVEPGDSGGTPDTTGPETPGVKGLWYTSSGMVIDIGEASIDITSSRGNQFFDILSLDNEASTMIVEGAGEESGGATYYGALVWVGPIGALQPGSDEPIKTLWLCPTGFGESLAEAETAAGFADGTDPGLSGCQGGPWMLLASIIDYAPYWGPDSCCFDHEESSGCSDAACEASVCEIDSSCCDIAWDWDCAECAVGGAGCEAVDCGVCDTCGDGVCDTSLESCGLCEADCGGCQCDADDEEMLACDGTCGWINAYGDSSCDPGFDCAELNWDDGDCCPDGQLEACDGGCVPPDVLGNGICDTALACPELAWDGGDCEVFCPEGQVPACEDMCGWEAKGDGACDWKFQCAEQDWDGGDCCPDGEIEGCDGSCVPDEAYGDGICDEALACQEVSWDDGDCELECSAFQIPACNNACHWEAYKGNGNCDWEFNCAELEWDGGDCCLSNQFMTCDGACIESGPTDDGACDPAFNCAQWGWDNGDCEPDCEPWQVLSCDGSDCLDIWSLDNGQCDEALNCSDYDFDAGGCCPEGYKQVCYTCIPVQGNVDGLHGNGECDEDYSCAATEFDGGDCGFSCPPHQLQSCWGEYCLSEGHLGDGQCNGDFQCEEKEWDGGDCCNVLVDFAACDGTCQPNTDYQAMLDNDVCDEALSCQQHSFDGGLCPIVCGPWDIPGCPGNFECNPPHWLGDGICDASFSCAEFQYDMGDCCPEDYVKDCTGECVWGASVGDGICHEGNSCPDFDWDGGDCPPDYCPEDEVFSCDSMSCRPGWLIGNDFCDDDLLCEQYDWDGGDCYVCGDGECFGAEEAVCPEDCTSCANSVGLDSLLLWGPELIGDYTDVMSLADVVVGPEGAYWTVRTDDGDLYATSFGPGNGPETLDVTLPEVTGGELWVSGEPSLSRSSGGHIAVAYRAGNAPGIWVQRLVGEQFAKAQLVTPEDTDLMFWPSLVHTDDDNMIVSFVYEEAGSTLSAVARLNSNGTSISGDIDVLGAELAATKHATALAASSNGAAVVAWIAEDAPDGPSLVIQEVHASGAQGDIITLAQSSDAGSILGQPALALDPWGTGIAAYQTLDPDGLWVVKFHLESQAILGEPTQLDDLPATMLGPAEFEGYDASRFDLAMNGDGWGLLAVGLTEMPSRLYRIGPAWELPPFTSFGEGNGVPRIAAATCYDDAVVVGPESKTNQHGAYRTVFQADDDGDGQPDMCCAP